MIEGGATQGRKGAVVGYGFIAERGHVPAYRASRVPLEIVAVADPCEARRELARKHLPDARIYADHRELMVSERGLIDFVDVTAPAAFHAEIATDALSRGLHVLCEKPLATTADEARGMLAAARRAERTLFPSHNYKHAPVVKAVRDILAIGAIGDVHLVTLDTFRRTHAKGVPEWRPDWRRERRYSGGGIAMDHGSHTFYLAFEWLRGYPFAISATTSTLGSFDTEDNVTAALRFSGGMASVHLTWTAGVRKVIYTIHGTRGAIRVEDDELEVARTLDDGTQRVSRSSVRSEWSDAGHPEWFESLLKGFASAMDRGEHVGPDAVDSLRCVELIGALYASAARGGREVRLGRAQPARRELTAEVGR